MNNRWGVAALGAVLLLGAPAVGGSLLGPALELLGQEQDVRNTGNTRAAANFIEQAQAASEQGNTTGADALFGQALERVEAEIMADPTNPLPWYQGGMAHVGLGSYQVADSMLAEAVRLRAVYELSINSLREQTWFSLYEEGFPLLDSGEYEAAIPVFEDAHSMYKERPEVMVQLGQMYGQLEEYDRSIELLRQAEGIIDSDRIEEQDSATVAQWQGIGRQLPVMITQTLMQAERYQEAVVELHSLLDTEPNNSSYKSSLALAFVQMDMPDSAAVLYDELVNTAGLDPMEYYQVGAGLYNSGSFLLAAQAFEAVVDAWPRDRDAAEYRARALELRSREDSLPEEDMRQLLEAGEKWLELDPMSQMAYVVVAGTANRLGDEDLARELMNTAAELPISLDNLQIQRDGQSAILQGDVANRTRDEGSLVRLEVTFYGEAGNEIGSETSTVVLTAPETSRPFVIQFQAGEMVSGYSYTVR